MKRGAKKSGTAQRAFRRFRAEHYRGDTLYVATAEFVLDMLLTQSTDFARACDIRILTAEDTDGRTAQCLWIYAPKTDYAQIAFFDCKQGHTAAAESVISQAETLTKDCGLHRLVAGLHGHLSYGVGILTAADAKNTFDTCYNKTYYASFFQQFPMTRTLSAYRNRVDVARNLLHSIRYDTDGYSVREADWSHFMQECETMRELCDRTIGQTYLYAPTEKKHFYQLLKDMKVLLTKRNLLFLQYNGKEVGFLFWHPDYNGVVKAGKPCSALQLAFGYATRRAHIDTVKLNAIGVLDEHRGRGTLALLRAMDDRIGDRYTYIETNFVWDNNRKSTLLNRRLLGEVCRKFEVYEETL